MPSPPRETELKLVLAPGEAARLAAHPALAGATPRRERFEAWYFDTPAGELARHRLGLRLRREGRRWRVTLKADGESGGGLHRRPEWEFPAGGPRVDLERFAHTPLAALPGAGTLHLRLAPILRTAFQRTRWHLAPGPGSRLEVALDEGVLAARGRERPVLEVEIEVLEGPESAAFELAESLAQDIGLRPEPASKLARGLALATSARQAPVHAVRVSLEEDTAPREAARRLAATCLAQAQANEAGVLASGDVEFVHQLRVALRRLRSALRLFGEALPPGELQPFAADLRWAAGQLGRCRDWDVFVTQTLPPLAAAYGDSPEAKAVAAHARARQREARREARAAILSPRYGLAMVRLARWLAAPAEPEGGGPGLKDFASRRLRKGARRVADGAARFALLDASGRHRLRILVKRQRYAVEFLGPLFRGEPARRHLRRLSRAQESLGLANDCANALAHVRELSPAPAFESFARGWFAARELAGLQACVRDLASVARARRFWRRKPASPAPASPA